VVHWSFLQSLSLLVTDIWRRFTSAFRAGSLVICHCLSSRSSGLFHCECRPVWTPWVVTRSTLGSRCRQSLQNGAGEVLIARVDCHPVVQFRIERNIIFQVSLKVVPFSAPEITAIRWVWKGRSTSSVEEYRKMIRAYCKERSHLNREQEVLHHHDIQDIGSSGGVVRVGRWGVRCKDQTGVSSTQSRSSLPRLSPRVPIHVFGVEVSGHQDGQSAETRGQVRSDQWAGRREVSRKDFHQK